jgi:glycosyltransferase involved in cell wall biosynthesis
VIEAMALKKSFVVTDADGNRDLIEDGENGYLVKDENSAHFATKIIALLEEEQTRKVFENKSIEKFNARFNIENTIPILEQLYLKEALN